MQATKRVAEADILRGLACVFMAIFHFGFDLGTFKVIEFSFEHPFWENFRYLIVSMFLILVGFSSYQAYHKGIRWNKVAYRVGKVGGAAAIITLATLFLSPAAWIYFGILHFIAVASLIALIFVRIPWIALTLGLAIMIAYPFALKLGQAICTTPWFWFQFDCWVAWAKPYLGLPNYTNDLLRFFPWIGMVLIGIFVGHMRLFGLRLPDVAVSRGLAFLGRHSLIFYLSHQLVLFPIAWGVSKLVN